MPMVDGDWYDPALFVYNTTSPITDRCALDGSGCYIPQQVGPTCIINATFDIEGDCDYTTIVTLDYQPVAIQYVFELDVYTLNVYQDSSWIQLNLNSSRVWTDGLDTYYSVDNEIFLYNGTSSVKFTDGDFYANFTDIDSLIVDGTYVWCEYNGYTVNTSIGFSPTYYSYGPKGVLVWTTDRVAFIDSYYCGVTYPYKVNDAILSAWLNDDTITVNTLLETETVQVAECQPNFRSAYPAASILTGANASEDTLVSFFSHVCSNFTTSCSDTEFYRFGCRNQPRCSNFFYYGSPRTPRVCNESPECNGYVSDGECRLYTQCDVVVPGNATHDNICSRPTGLWEQPELCGTTELANYSLGGFVGCVPKPATVICSNGMLQDVYGNCPDAVSPPADWCIESIIINVNVADQQFLNCMILQSVTLLSTVRVLGVESFKGTLGLESVIFPITPIIIEARAFEGSGIQYLDLTGPATLYPLVFSNSLLVGFTGTVKLLESDALSNAPLLTDLPVFNETIIFGNQFQDTPATEFVCISCEFFADGPGIGASYLTFYNTNITTSTFDGTVPGWLQVDIICIFRQRTKRQLPFPERPIETLYIFNIPYFRFCEDDLNSLTHLELYNVDVVGDLSEHNIETLIASVGLIESLGFANNPITHLNLSGTKIIEGGAFENIPANTTTFDDEVDIAAFAFVGSNLSYYSLSYCSTIHPDAFGESVCCVNVSCPITAGDVVDNCSISELSNKTCLNCTAAYPRTYNQEGTCYPCNGFCTVGQFVQEYCNDTVNIICATCPVGTYQDSKSHRYTSCRQSKCTSSLVDDKCPHQSPILRLVIFVSLTVASTLLLVVYVQQHAPAIFHYDTGMIFGRGSKVSKKK